MNNLTELNGLIKSAETTLDKIWLQVKKQEDKEVTKEMAMREIDLLARELQCISGTIKHVAYEIRTPVVLDKWRHPSNNDLEKHYFERMGSKYNP